ncbi:hypothetical protein DPEC_G00298840 [Dallia pectoralis]|uniref:Uncharacterized protein n=1 Tax=Dallia pectoralis TaxID=75939 RepID=A0ACC2FG02_DALPE|nr:hypothetical protein DPEC_G00298840 [Dallia pectoralis]
MLSGQKTDSTLAVLLLFFSATNVKQTNGSPETLSTVNILLKSQEMKSLGGDLYTPTMDDYKQKCPSETLMCYAAEMHVLVLEVKRPLMKRLEVQLLQLKDTHMNNPKCAICESYSLKPPIEFLTTLLGILEHINAVSA